MYRSKSARSGVSDASRDHEDSNDIEINRLQQRLRIAEGERTAIRQDREYKKKHQIEELKKLQRERDEIAKNYELAVSRQNKTRDAMYTNEIQAGIDRLDALDKEVAKEKEIQSHLDSDLRRGEKRNQNIRVRSANLRNRDGKKPDAAADRQQNDLEGRLDRARSKYSANLSENSELRKEINTLVISHRNFESANKKLEKKVNGIKQEINQVMEASSIAHEQREEAKHKTVLLRERAEKDLAQYATDIKDLQRSAENDFILKEFMDIKNQEREERATGSTNAKKARMREMELLLQKCETSWDRIREISETDDLEQLLDQFTETERENFALFNFINELNNIIEQESEEIEHINVKFDEDKENMLSSDEDRNERLQALKDKVETEREFKDKKQEELEESNSQFEELREGVQRMLTQLEIDFKIDNNSRMMDSLGEIEEKLNELIAAKAVIMEELDPENVSAIKHILVPQPPALPLDEEAHQVVVAPSTGNVQPSQSVAISEATEVEPDRSVSTTADGVALSIETIRERVRLKYEHGNAPSSSRAQIRKMSMRPAPGVVQKTEDEDIA